MGLHTVILTAAGFKENLKLKINERWLYSKYKQNPKMTNKNSNRK